LSAQSSQESHQIEKTKITKQKNQYKNKIICVFAGTSAKQASTAITMQHYATIKQSKHTKRKARVLQQRRWGTSSPCPTTALW
jgi:hypothetical protein